MMSVKMLKVIIFGLNFSESCRTCFNWCSSHCMGVTSCHLFGCLVWEFVVIINFWAPDYYEL